MPKKKLIGTVTSTKMKDTATVQILMTKKDPLYGKIIKKSKKFHAHDAGNVCNVGDKVEIEECTPISKTKKYKVINVIKKSVISEKNIETPESVETPGGES